MPAGWRACEHDAPQLDAEEAAVAGETAELGRTLVEQGLSTRDAGAALGVSGARISQTRAS